MLVNLMLIQKFINSKVNRDYVFITGTIEINIPYFIDKINRGCSEKTNKNYQTHIKGGMTDWDYFNNDPELGPPLMKILDCIDKQLDPPAYELCECWGFIEKFGDRSTFHGHPHFLSGVIYLSKGQDLEFPEIKQTIKADEGVFGIFSSFLKHGCYRNHTSIPKYGLSFNLRDTSGY